MLAPLRPNWPKPLCFQILSTLVKGRRLASFHNDVVVVRGPVVERLPTLVKATCCGARGPVTTDVSRLIERAPTGINPVSFKR